MELELFLITYFDAFSKDGIVHVRTKFFTSRHLDSGAGEGLFVSLKAEVDYMNVENCRTKMIGFGCDGGRANRAEGGLNGILKKEFPWIFLFLCLGHHILSYSV